MTIGQRAARAIRERIGSRRVGQELTRLDIDPYSYGTWNRGRNNPSAGQLRKLAIHGYDVMEILLGDEQKGGKANA